MKNGRRAQWTHNVAKFLRVRASSAVAIVRVRATAIASANVSARRLKVWWKRQHFYHVFLTIVASGAAAVSAGITVRGFLIYQQEAPTRTEQLELLRLQTINSAWETLRITKGSDSERGQSAAIKTLLNLGLHLGKLDLSKTAFANLDLQRIDLRGANFDDAQLSHVNFDYGQLAGASMFRAILTEVSINPADGLPTSLDNTLIINSKLSNIIFASKKNGSESVIGGELADFRHAIVIRTKLGITKQYGTFASSCLLGAEFRSDRFPYPSKSSYRLSLRFDDFSRATIVGGSFEHVDLSGANFHGAEFKTPGSFLDGIFSPEADDRTGPRPDFSDAELRALIEKGVIPECVTDAETLHRVRDNIRDLIFENFSPWLGSPMEDDENSFLTSNLQMTDFSDTILVATRFEGADLRNTVGITQAAINEACVDELTKLPAGLVLPSVRCERVVLQDDETVQRILKK